MKRARVLSCIVLGIVALGGVVGCGRHVVVAPATVERANGHAWIVKSEPVPAGVPVPVRVQDR